MEQEIDSPSQTRVFVSYTHDSPEHSKRVGALVARLREVGIYCCFDQDEEAPEVGWPRWMNQQLADASHVIVVCTETYRRRFDLKEVKGVGKGAQWESFLTNQVLFEEGGKTDKFIPVVFVSHDLEYIPLPLRAFTHYQLTADGEMERLCNRLMGRPTEITHHTAPLSDIVRNDVPVVIEQRPQSPRGGGAIAVDGGKVAYELIVDLPFEELTEERQNAIGKAVCNLVGTGGIIVRGKRRGSTKLVLLLPPELVERLQWAVDAGELAQFGVIGGEAVSLKSVTSPSGALDLREFPGITHSEIAQRAHEIWRARGCPHGQDEQIWHEAETQLASEVAIALAYPAHDESPGARAEPGKITSDMIAERAHEIWVRRGCRPGEDEQNWREAERQLRAEYGGS
jgi:hypothetical protein